MSKKLIIGLVSGGLVAAIVLILVMMNVSYKNAEIELRNQATAQEETNKATFDKVWKTLKQKAGVTDKYAADFKSTFGGLMKDRYAGDQKGNPMFKWIQERNPKFSVELYKDLSQAIESNRATFLRVQNRLVDIKREHDNLRQKFPSSIFVGSKPELEVTIVTSSKTEKTFQTGKEENVELF